MNENPLQESGSHADRNAEPCIIVIFGASGDLTARKLVPALYNLSREQQLPANFATVGFARREKSHDDFRAEMKKSTSEFSRTKPLDEKVWNYFSERLFYHQSEFDKPEGYQRLKTYLEELDTKFGTKGNRVFYLSTQPRYFPVIIKHMNESGLIYPFNEKGGGKWSRVIIEKPFGHDLDSAKALQAELMNYIHEKQIFRIDHYLGKETVQNILAFRFSNAIFESLWNNRYIDHVQITAAESIGVGTRGKFYEEEGLVRDFMQNHIMQLLSLVAMEPPSNMGAEHIRDEKVKVLESLHPFNEETLKTGAVRGQYGKGLVEGEEVKGYREEDNVDPNSGIETFGAMRVMIDNVRWHGVPFYLRGAKRLAKRATEIAVVFKLPPPILFGEQEENVLAMRIQPNEGISLRMNCKVPGPSSPIQPVTMDFRYSTFFGASPPEAYERLICDCIVGDNTLFAREDEVFGSWNFITPLLEYWAGFQEKDFPNYEAGSWGPQAADEMMKRDGRKWRLI